MKAHSEKFIQRRRFLMVLPLLVTPFVTMIFWALGGGKGASLQAAVPNDQLNASLPEAHFGKGEVWNKLSLYELAERDSARFREARQRDPYFDLITVESQTDDTAKQESGSLMSSFPQKDDKQIDSNEERVNKKLNELYREINKSQPSVVERSEVVNTTPKQQDNQFTQNVDRLEAMMEMMKETGKPDPEMEQIEGVLDKLLDVQHPDRVKQRLQAVNEERNAKAYAVEQVTKNDNISLLRTPITSLTDIDTILFQKQVWSLNGFFGLDSENLGEYEPNNAIRAVIHDTQGLVTGSTVRIRLVEDVEINGRLIRKGQLIYGVCSIQGERLQISVEGIRAENSLLPVSLTVFDLDGIEGIYVPGAIARDAAKQASDNALQNIQFMSVDPSLGAQAAIAGVEAAKGMFSKKSKLIKVSVKAGYKILLKDTSPAGK